MMIVDPEDCELVALLAMSVPLKAAIAFRIAAGFVGMICMCVVLKYSDAHARVHRNAKLLIVLHYVWTVGLCVAYVINHGFSFVQLWVYRSDPCDRLISTTVSYNLGAIVIFFVILQMSSIVALAIERLIATCRATIYENEKSTFLAVLLVVSQTVVAASIPYAFLLFGVDWDEAALGPSTVTPENRMRNQWFAALFVVFELLSVLFMHALYKANRWRCSRLRKGSEGCALSTRYQLDENLRALRLIIPFLWIHFVFNATTGGLVYLFVALEDILGLEAFNVCDRLNGVLTLYPMTLLIFLLYRNPTLRDELRKSVSALHISTKVHCSQTDVNRPTRPSMVPNFVTGEDTNMRFAQLKEMFDAGTAKPSYRFPANKGSH